MESWSFAVNQLFLDFALVTWLGGIFMEAIGASVIFSNIQPREAAGVLNAVILKRLERIKYLCIVILIVTISVRGNAWEETGSRNAIRVWLALLMVSTALTSSLLIAPYLRRFIANKSPMQSPDAKRSLAFRKWHLASVALLLVEILAGALFWFFI